MFRTRLNGAPTLTPSSRKGQGVRSQEGSDTWFFLTSDYAVGHSFRRIPRIASRKSGQGCRLVRTFPSARRILVFCSQAQALKAKVHRPKKNDSRMSGAIADHRSRMSRNSYRCIRPEPCEPSDLHHDVGVSVWISRRAHLTTSF